MNTDNLKSKQRIPTTPILTILNEYQWLKTLQEKNKVQLINNVFRSGETSLQI